MKYTSALLFLSCMMVFSCKTLNDPKTKDSNFIWVNHLDLDWLVMIGDDSYLSIQEKDLVFSNTENQRGLEGRKLIKRGWKNFPLKQLNEIEKVSLNICIDLQGLVIASHVLYPFDLSEDLEKSVAKGIFSYRYNEGTAEVQCGLYDLILDLDDI